MSQSKPAGLLNTWQKDVPASIVVFLVALPLCLGIAQASEVPLFAGLISGIIGGIVVGYLSGSALSVSGPAAGLITIVLVQKEALGGFQAFALAVLLAGLFQLAFGFLKLGTIAYFFPVSVIKGMLAAIGLTLILKQIPHALGSDNDPEGQLGFVQPDGENTFSELWLAIQHLSAGAVTISLISLAILILAEQKAVKKLLFFKIVPAPFLVVGLGIGLNLFFEQFVPGWYQAASHRVALEVSGSTSEFLGQFNLPDFTALRNYKIYVAAFTIALVASLETLLSVEATDKLDPLKRSTPVNRELRAQGVGNTLSGLIGGLPITAVIVRSSANVSSGAQSKVSAILHGLFLLSTAVFIPHILNLIPLSSLAAILLLVGYKLAKPSLVLSMYDKGWDQFAPFAITIIAILFTDLLQGILIGIGIGLLFVIKTNYRKAVTVTHIGSDYLIKLKKDVSFVNKAYLRHKLNEIPANSEVIIDGTRSQFIDNDIAEMLEDYRESARNNNIVVTLKSTAVSN